MYSTIILVSFNTQRYCMTVTELHSGVKRPGRLRDARIDERVIEVAGRHLADQGFTAMSVAAIAREAGTTRQAIYRRWPDKTRLAAAVVGDLWEHGSAGSPADAMSPFVDPFGDLVRELADFAGGVSGPGRLSLVGTMLQDTTEASVLQQYRDQVVAPRRRRIREILEQAGRLGLVDAEADLEVAVTLGTGSWYARALAGDPVPDDWPARTAALVWRAVGGAVSEPATKSDTPTQRGGADG
jgi:AcrR family transcriptional regulator